MRTKTILLTAALVAGYAIGTHAQTCGQLGTRDNMSVSTAWLADHLHDPNLAIFAVGSEGEFSGGHIPGARPLEYMDTHEMELNGLSVEMPTMAKLEKLFGGFGVSNSSRIVLYRSSDMFSPTTRIYLELDAMGLGSQSSILDGGFEQWSREGRPISKDAPVAAAPQSLKACPRSAEVLATLDDVKAAVKKLGAAIIDAREKQFYIGASQPSGQRKGHIPGAGNLPYEDLYDSQGKLKSEAELQSLLHGAGVKPGDRVIVYCHVGQRATAVYFAARYLGYDARLYDGSWEDWSRHKDLPAETGSH